MRPEQPVEVPLLSLSLAQLRERQLDADVMGTLERLDLYDRTGRLTERGEETEKIDLPVRVARMCVEANSIRQTQERDPRYLALAIGAIEQDGNSIFSWPGYQSGEDLFDDEVVAKRKEGRMRAKEARNQLYDGDSDVELVLALIREGIAMITRSNSDAEMHAQLSDFCAQYYLHSAAFQRLLHTVREYKERAGLSGSLGTLSNSPAQRADISQLAVAGYADHLLLAFEGFRKEQTHSSRDYDDWQFGVDAIGSKAQLERKKAGSHLPSYILADEKRHFGAMAQSEEEFQRSRRKIQLSPYSQAEGKASALCVALKTESMGRGTRRVHGERMYVDRAYAWGAHPLTLKEIERVQLPYIRIFTDLRYVSETDSFQNKGTASIGEDELAIDTFPVDPQEAILCLANHLAFMGAATQDQRLKDVLTRNRSIFQTQRNLSKLTGGRVEIFDLAGWYESRLRELGGMPSLKRIAPLAETFTAPIEPLSPEEEKKIRDAHPSQIRIRDHLVNVDYVGEVRNHTYEAWVDVFNLPRDVIFNLRQEDIPILGSELDPIKPTFLVLGGIAGKTTDIEELKRFIEEYEEKTHKKLP